MACTKSPPIVAALAYDGVVKLWYVDDVDYDDTEDVIEEGSYVNTIEATVEFN